MTRPGLLVGDVVGGALPPVGGEAHAARLRVAPIGGGEGRVGQALPDPLGRGMDVGRVHEGVLVGVSHGGGLQCRLEIGQGLGPRPVVVVDPTVGDVGDGGGVEIVELLPPPPERRDQSRRLEDVEVLGHGLPGHAHAGAELAQGEPAALVEPIEQAAASGVAQGLEDRIHISHRLVRCGPGCFRSFMQPFGCSMYLSSHTVACQGGAAYGDAGAGPGGRWCSVRPPDGSRWVRRGGRGRSPTGPRGPLRPS